MTDPNIPIEAQSHDATPDGDLVTVDAAGNLHVDLEGAMEHIPDSIIRPNERGDAIEQLRHRVARILAENVAQELANEILAATSPDPEVIEVPGEGGIELPPSGTPAGPVLS